MPTVAGETVKPGQPRMPQIRAISASFLSHPTRRRWAILVFAVKRGFPSTSVEPAACD